MIFGHTDIPHYLNLRAIAPPMVMGFQVFMKLFLVDQRSRETLNIDLAYQRLS